MNRFVVDAALSALRVVVVSLVAIRVARWALTGR